jgi:hypothetical protein
MEEDTTTRRELMAPYEHPFRFALAETWRRQPELRRATVGGAVAFAVGSAGLALGAGILGLLGGLGAMVVWLVAALWVIGALREGFRLVRAWRQPSELGRVRAQRPQAGTEDAEVAHDQFAVTVEDDGWLLTWRFRPLRATASPADEEIEVPGRPRYGARVVEDRQFDVRDAARAAEQLVTAQERAAERETAAAAAAHRARERAAGAEELALEARSTAAALQRATGQRSRRD